MWTADLIKCFRCAVESIVKYVPLYIADPKGKFVVQTDACDVGLGAILFQQVDGEDRPISFISRKLTSAEQNYPTIEKECLAIKWAIERFHDYLYGHTFLVRTDHAP